MKNKLVKAIIGLLKQNKLTLNRNDAAGWVSNDCFYFVSKGFLDELRCTLADESLSIPDDNSEFMSMLYDLGLIVKANDSFVNKATVSIKNNDGSVDENTFTILCVPMNMLWVDKVNWFVQPEIFKWLFIMLKRLSIILS